MDYKLSELFDLQMGKTPSRDNSAYWDNPQYAWISIADLTNAGKYITNTKESLSALAVEESGIRIIPAQTVVMSFKLSIGKVAITPVPMYSNEAIMAFVDRGIVKINPEYLYFLFLHRDWEEGTNKAVMGKTLNKATLSNVKVSIHPFEEQREIVVVLNNTASMIEKYKQQLQTLDQLIKARFVEMFGDLRTNPLGWKLEYFDDITELITDGEHATPRRVNQGIYLLSARNVLNHALQLEDVDYIDEEEYDRIAKRVIPQEGDVLISCSGTVGRCCSVPHGIQFQMVRSAALLRFKPSVLSVFAEYMITSDYLQEQINQSKTASSQANLFQGKIAKLKGFVPPKELQHQFAAFVSQVDKSKVVEFSVFTKRAKSYII